MNTPSATLDVEETAASAVVLYADHYPVPELYESCLKEAEHNTTGNPLYAASLFYLMEALGKDTFYYPLETQWGEIYLFAVMAAWAPEFRRQLEAVEEGKEGMVLPVVSQVMVSALYFALNQEPVRPMDISLVVNGLSSYVYQLQHEKDELAAHLTSLVPLLEDMAKGKVTKVRVQRWKQRLDEYTQEVALPAKMLTDLRSEYRAICKANEASVALPMMVKQIDGSEAEDRSALYLEIIKPTTTKLTDPEEQFLVSLEGHSPQIQGILRLWWKLNAYYDDNSRLIQAWAAAAAGRLLQVIFTDEQLATMESLLDVDEVVEVLMRFILAETGQVQAVTWPQLRMSSLAPAIAKTAQSAETLEAHAEAIYRKLDLGAELAILQSTLRIHGEAMRLMVNPTESVTKH